MIPTISDLAAAAGVNWFGYQHAALVAAQGQPGPRQRRLLYYKTGAGKSLTALAQLRLWGHQAATVVTPPSTYPQWREAGSLLGVEVSCMSHAKFRMKATKLSRTQAVIADEFHLFGGHDGQGWKKLDRLSLGLQAPLILCSATPNYNDAERCYCIQHVLDPHSCKGGFLAYIYAHCKTEPNYFGLYPNVVGFLAHKDAAAYLSSLPNVDYLADDLVYKIQDFPVWKRLPTEFTTYGLNIRRDRIIASAMERRHAEVDLTLLDDASTPSPWAQQWLSLAIDNSRSHRPVLVFAQHQTVARAAESWLAKQGHRVTIVDGDVSTKKKAERIAAFKDGVIDVLVGTASLATGTDGLDKVCDTLLILDDTDDDSLRRQLIGRIMPRGTSTNVSSKVVARVVLT